MIKIISGFYGRAGYSRPMSADDGAFSIEEAEEARLVRRGVAAYVDEVGYVPDESDMGAVGSYSVDSPLEELRDLMYGAGLAFRVGMSKADMVSALDGFYAGGAGIALGDASGDVVG